MILDKLLNLSEEQAITADAASTNVLDFKEAGDAVGQELTLEVRVTTTFAAGSNDTLQIKLQTSADNVNWSDVVLSPDAVVNGKNAGETLFKIRVPQGLKRYARLFYDVTGTITAGAVTSFMSKEL